MILQEKIKDILVNNYGLIDPIFFDAPRGFVAETYIVKSGEKKYFLKVHTLSRYSDNLKMSLPVLYELHKNGIENISYPISTKNGELLVKFSDKILTLYDCIDGVQTFDYDFEKYVKLLAHVHAKSKSIQAPIKKETFELLSLDDLQKGLDQIYMFDGHDAIINELKNLLSEHHDFFLKIISKIIKLSEKLRKKPCKLYITHGDAPCNILKDHNNQMYLIDWDDLILAPAERDTWFHIDTDREEDFMKIYRKFHPHYEVDSEAFAFYLYSRFLNDLEGYISKILEENFSQVEKQKNLDELKHDCFDWLYPLIQKSSTNL